ncbi:transposase [Pandoraea fibrosis]|uniref:Transposase n=2 Tax=Pandoraea fibrosis TaxID=1891094 RepID=A0A5E4WCT3_9BURK|nr:transposase [Pandoraea fibrosis]
MTCWRRLRDWQSDGAWERLHLALLKCLREHDQIDWSRASIDGAYVRAPPGGRADRAEPHRSGQTWQQASPDCRQARRASGADYHGCNRHDSMVFEALVGAILSVRGLSGRPRCRPDKLHVERAMTLHVADNTCASGASRKNDRLGKYRWVVECKHAWLAGFRKLRSASSDFCKRISLCSPRLAPLSALDLLTGFVSRSKRIRRSYSK